jgi:hypothetical protein
MTSHRVTLVPNLLLALALGGALATVSVHAPALAPDDDGDPNAQQAPAQLLSAEELDQVVGPIALYPDELVSLVLPASTYPLDVVQAARFLDKREKDPELKPSDRWDPSVLGLLNYPEVVTMMNDDLDWTERLGTAVINQQQDVMDAIQDFRQRAQAAGNLQSDDKQVIVQEKETIIIQSSSPEVIYVPRYDPVKVVVHQPAPVYYYYPTPYPYYYSPAATFWTGMFVGAAIAYGINGSWGWRRGDVTINRNVNISGGNRNVNIGGGGSSWKPSRPSGGRPPGSRPGYGDGGRPGAGGGRPGSGRPEGGRPGGGRPGAGRPEGGRPGAGRPEGGRPSAGTRPSQPAGQRPGAGTRPSQPSAGSRPSTRPSTRPTQPSAGARPSTRPSQPRTSTRQTRSRSSSNAFGGYSRGSQTARSSQRGARSRAGSHGSARSGGARGGGRAGGGGRRGGRR